MNNNRRLSCSTWGALMGCALLLAGCKANQAPLDQFRQQIESSARHQVASLAPVLEFKASAYQAHDLREPFVLPKVAIAMNQPVAKVDCWQPEPRRKSGRLERYPLSKLRLTGVMSSQGAISALIQVPTGEVIKATRGQYIGVNNGKITKVTQSYLTINETLPDGLGCWNTRNVKLALK